jgi:hypothetical protein
MVFVRRKRTDPEKLRASLGTHRPFCGYSIPPNELQRTDFTHVLCPKSRKEFAPGARAVAWQLKRRQLAFQNECDHPEVPSRASNSRCRTEIRSARLW